MGLFHSTVTSARRVYKKLVCQTALKPKLPLRLLSLVITLVGVLLTAEVLGCRRLFTSDSDGVPIYPDHLDYTENIDRIETLYGFKDGILTRLNETGLKFADRNKTTHIAFLKVHKAGSTTIQNLMFRFGMKHNLNILLPKTANHLQSKDLAMPLKSAEHYDILAIHATYSPELFGSLLPEDSVYIGIVREPVDRMISAAYYYRDVYRKDYLQKVPKINFIHNLVQEPDTYEKSFFSYTRNTMGHDFGFNETKPTDRNYIHKYLNELNSRFLLVLIMEKFEESLVFMRRLLGWSISDILYLKTNTNDHKLTMLGENQKKKLRLTSFLDFEIYDYFLNVFNEKLKSVGDEFWEEVSFFKAVLQQVKEFCFKIDYSNNAKLEIRSSNWSDEFKVSSSDCAWMSTKELTFIAKLRKRHVLLHRRNAI